MKSDKKKKEKPSERNHRRFVSLIQLQDQKKKKKEKKRGEGGVVYIGQYREAFIPRIVTVDFVVAKETWEH